MTSMSADCPLCRKLAQLDALPPDEVVVRFPHAVALLGPWQYHTGYTILVARPHVAELHHLDPAIRNAFVGELCRVAEAIEAAFHPHKLNVESLGNQVPHLHFHLFPRRADDPDRAKPAWLAIDRAERDLAEKTRLETGLFPRHEIAERLRQSLRHA
jgi:diadenosine tetraphosphate (Ap4A) HIT family hydrolase